MITSTAFRILTVFAFSAIALPCNCSQPFVYDSPSLDEAFKDAQEVDLSISGIPSVVRLREVVKIPPPTQTVLVKTFRRESMPVVLEQAFQNPGTSGVTIGGRYVAIIHTDLKKEYNDVLSHEMVHAYISLVSPKPLPFWFQEGGAVHYSTDKTLKFYGQPSKDQVGTMEGKVVQLNEVYERKLRSFHFLIEKAGEKEFNEWFRNAVITGVVDPRPLVGISQSTPSTPRSARKFPTWLICLGAGVIIVVLIIGYCAARREMHIYS